MNDDEIQKLQSVNYWDQGPKETGFLRENYTNMVLEHTNNHLLKVLVGQRRSGKSYILKQVITRLIAKGIVNKNILYLNFELHELNFIQNIEKLIDVIEYYLKDVKQQGKVYLFFDEIQEIENWEKIINSISANERYETEIFITGSNAHLLSTELSTYITGRYIEIPVFPFSFIEFIQFYQLKQNRNSLIKFLESSGIPELLNLKDNAQKSSYTMALRDSIIVNDIIKRFNIKEVKLLMLLLEFLADNIGHLFSFNAVVKKLKSIGIQVNAITVSNYIHYLEMTFLVHGVTRFDIKGKRILDGERKYYLNDLAIPNYLTSEFDSGINKKLENYVFLALCQAGFQVHVGNIYDLEIDFVAEKNKKLIYVQVAYLLASDDVIAREYGNLEKIKDNWPKWVVSLDDVSFPPKNGILHVPAWKLVDRLSEVTE